jgi:hypothetical protein
MFYFLCGKERRNTLFMSDMHIRKIASQINARLLSFLILCVLPIGFQVSNRVVGGHFTHGDFPPVWTDFIFLQISDCGT